MFEEKIRKLTQKINGQYPRPWMTALPDPMDARVFVVGANQATAYTDEIIQSHDEHLDIHFNRNGYNCNSFYQAIRGGKTSKSRINIERLTEILKESGTSKILETNLVCYSTKSYSELKHPKHVGGKDVGLSIFKTLVGCIRPRILILHGAKVRKEFCREFKTEVPEFPMNGGIPVQRNTPIQTEIEIEGYRTVVFPMPSLALPASNSWSFWAEEYLTVVAHRVKDILNQ